jgi:uncharacterized coiled-coil protein SlyX
LGGGTCAAVAVEHVAQRRYAQAGSGVATLEERVAFLEGQVSEHSQTLVDIRDSVRQIERRFDALEDKFERRFEGLDEKVSRQFVWLVGIQVTTLVAIVSALLARS